MTAEEIVRALAAKEDPRDHQDACCSLCDRLDGHQEICPYRMAREWVEGQEQKRPPIDWGGAVCKGSWLFGNNCKTCARCLATKPKGM